MTQHAENQGISGQSRLDKQDRTAEEAGQADVSTTPDIQKDAQHTERRLAYRTANRHAGRTTDHALGLWRTTAYKSGDYDICLRTLGSRHMTQCTENQRVSEQS